MEKEKILIVDDNPLFITQVIDSMSAYSDNYIFFQANNGKIAFNIAKSRKPNIILTDWNMPICNGIDFTKRIKAERSLKNIPVIMITAINISSDDLKIALQAGAIDFIRKPIDKIELQARVHSALMLSNMNKKNIETKNSKIEQHTLHLIEKDSIIHNINKKLKILYSHIDNKERIAEFYIDIKKEMLKNSKIDIWSSFEKSFSSTNFEFTTRVLKAHPTITNSELKLCMLMSMSLSTKDIARILNQEQNTVKVTRSRIRKKFEIERSVNLQLYLNRF